MPTLRSWFSGPKRLLWSFALILLAPALAVVWLGLRLIAQDRDLETRLRLERRQVAADRLVAGLERVLAATERQLDAAPSAVAVPSDGDAIVVAFGTDAIEARPARLLLFSPAPAPDIVDQSENFADGEGLEFGGALSRAEEAYRSLAGSPDEARRAGALVRLARTQRKLGRPDEALATYQALALAAGGRVAGLPADLVGRRARLALLADLGRRWEVRQEAAALQHDLLNGRWLLDRGTFISYASQVRGWVGSEPVGVSERVALAEATHWLWQEWRRGGLAPAGRMSAPRVAEGDVTVLWRTRGDGGVVALLAGPRFRARSWLEPLVAADTPAVVFEHPGSRSAQADGAAGAVRRSAADTGLPWTLVFTGPARDPGGIDSRGPVVIAGLALLLAVVLAGAVVVARGVTHELEVARLQSDFVSAVSHEFRTPLTSLQQFTSLLNDEEEPGPEKRRAFYQAQARAVHRLQRLVESLLDFGRIEAGAYPYRMVRIPVGTFVAEAVDGFRQVGAPASFVVDCTCDPDCGDMLADAEALSRALTNLLENAVKYSGAGRRIDVRAARTGRTVLVSVSDQGLGVPKAEQARIFTKFVRGASSRLHGINGSGIGLAMAREILRAHGGDITVESDGRTGSTFTITLPAAGGATPLEVPAA